MNRRLPRWAIAAAMVALLVVAAVIAGPPDQETPLDPESTAPSGLRGVRDLLRSVDVDSTVTLDPPADETTRVFVPVDLLGSDRRERLRDWVERGGTLVVADATSPLHGLTATAAGFADVVGATPRAPACDLPPLAEVSEVLHAAWNSLEVPADATGCFPLGGDGDDGDAWLVVRSVGEGTVIALGSPDPFTNAQLDRADNAVLAAALLGPAPGDRLSIVPRPPVGEGDVALLDLVPTRIWRGLGVLFVALVLALLWRSRRLGPPVAERLPPVLPSAELARSVAGLLQRAHSRQGAAAQLRADCRRELVDRLGATSRSEPHELVGLAVTRIGVTPETASSALLDGPVPDDDALVAVARATAAVRHAAASGQPAAGPPRPTERISP